MAMMDEKKNLADEELEQVSGGFDEPPEWDAGEVYCDPTRGGCGFSCSSKEIPNRCPKCGLFDTFVPR